MYVTYIYLYITNKQEPHHNSPGTEKSNSFFLCHIEIYYFAIAYLNHSQEYLKYTASLWANRTRG